VKAKREGGGARVRGYLLSKVSDISSRPGYDLVLYLKRHREGRRGPYLPRKGAAILLF